MRQSRMTPKTKNTSLCDGSARIDLSKVSSGGAEGELKVVVLATDSSE